MPIQHGNAVPAKPREHPDVRRNALIMAIVDTACELRDVDWEHDDPGPALERHDAAVDAWRKHLLSGKVPRVSKT